MLKGLRRGVPAFLASVTSAAEAEIALRAGAEIIDAKNPVQGALGALAIPDIQSIVKAVGGRVTVSATIGDLPSDAAVISAAAEAVAATGVDIVKAGFFGQGPHREAIGSLGKARIGHARLAGVLMADHDPDFSLVPFMARAGFVVVMLDTAVKGAGGLRQALDDAQLAEFLGLARRHGLVAGLAGSLSIADIAPLARLAPDLLGFRGALCAAGRQGPMDAERAGAVAFALKSATANNIHGPSDPMERSVA
jgi:(5-formylfuran-3-yl)methyl phosphate synthase